MQSRRQLLQSGLIVSAATLVPLRTTAPFLTTPGPHRIRPELFVYDARYPAAQAAARQALRDAIRVASTHEVFTHLWYDELDLRWRRAPMTLAGSTTAHGLHVLETLALDRQMRVIERAELPGDDLIHWLIAPAPRRRPA